MPDLLTLDEFHERLVRETLGSHLTEDQAFLIFFLFHNYQFELMGPVVSDCPGIERICALTQRGCASVLASFWSDPDDPRSTDEHWYWKWNTEWDSGENLTRDESLFLFELIVKMQDHPLVSRIVPED